MPFSARSSSASTLYTQKLEYEENAKKQKSLKEAQASAGKQKKTAAGAKADAIVSKATGVKAAEQVQEAGDKAKGTSGTAAAAAAAPRSKKGGKDGATRRSKGGNKATAQEDKVAVAKSAASGMEGREAGDEGGSTAQGRAGKVGGRGRAKGGTKRGKSADKVSEPAHAEEQGLTGDEAGGDGVAAVKGKARAPKKAKPKPTLKGKAKMARERKVADGAADENGDTAFAEGKDVKVSKTGENATGKDKARKGKAKSTSVPKSKAQAARDKMMAAAAAAASTEMGGDESSAEEEFSMDVVKKDSAKPKGGRVKGIGAKEASTGRRKLGVQGQGTRPGKGTGAVGTKQRGSGAKLERSRSKSQKRGDAAHVEGVDEGDTGNEAGDEADAIEAADGDAYMATTRAPKKFSSTPQGTAEVRAEVRAGGSKNDRPASKDRAAALAKSSTPRHAAGGQMKKRRGVTKREAPKSEASASEDDGDGDGVPPDGEGEEEDREAQRGGGSRADVAGWDRALGEV